MRLAFIDVVSWLEIETTCSGCRPAITAVIIAHSYQEWPTPKHKEMVCYLLCVSVYGNVIVLK